MSQVISNEAVQRRNYWIGEIQAISGNFSDNYARLERELMNEVRETGLQSLIDHLRLCGTIPEMYKHDSSEEKLYSKYTDCIIALTFSEMGLRSIVLTERADAADVEVFAKKFDFVADAKAFRISRTAKNQKDFKVESMHGWKKGKTNAMVVCPIHQLPTTTSQIYQSATVRDVCVFTYSHLSLLLSYLTIEGPERTQDLLYRLFKVITTINPSKAATPYWFSINSTMLAYSNTIADLWQTEKLASVESIHLAKEEALTFLSNERTRIMNMDHQEALNELISINKFDEKIATIQKVKDSKIFAIK